MVCVLVLSRNTDVNAFTDKAVEYLTNSEVNALTDLFVKCLTNTLYKLLQ